MTPRTINFKDPLWMAHFLDTALDKEKKKYQACPVNPDYVPDHEAADVWGYVLAGYFLVEESFKALLHLRNQEVPRKHSLTILFDLFDHADKERLREFHSDYLATNDGYNQFPFGTLDDFLANLDGDPNPTGTDYVGSFDWRYFLIEEKSSPVMPMIGIELLHEIVYGCVRMIEYAHNGNFEPSRYTHSWRLRWTRMDRYNDWLLVQGNNGEWVNLDGKLAILWGPDYLERYDMALFRGKSNPKGYFAELPLDDFALPIVDKREELEDFDADEGFRSIEISVSRPTAD